MKKKSAVGVSLIEMTMAVTIFIILIGGLSLFLKLFSKSAVQGHVQVQSILASQQLFSFMETDLYLANEVTLAEPQHIRVICDSNRWPGYKPLEDYDNDTIPNENDADIDGDLGGALWTNGFNLPDDDELPPGIGNQDGKIDVQIEYYLEGRDVYKDFSINEESWGAHKKLIATNISSFTFTYFGSMGHPAASTLDFDGNNIITSTEIARRMPGNNGNDVIDNAAEYQAIASIRIYVEIDPNNDGKPDQVITSEFHPPLMPLKHLTLD